MIKKEIKDNKKRDILMMIPTAINYYGAYTKLFTHYVNDFISDT